MRAAVVPMRTTECVQTLSNTLKHVLKAPCCCSSPTPCAPTPTQHTPAWQLFSLPVLLLLLLVLLFCCCSTPYSRATLNEQLMLTHTQQQRQCTHLEASLPTCLAGRPPTTAHAAAAAQQQQDRLYECVAAVHKLTGHQHAPTLAVATHTHTHPCESLPAAEVVDACWRRPGLSPACQRVSSHSMSAMSAPAAAGAAAAM